MFKLQKEKGVCTLVDIKTNIAVKSMDLANLFFIADVIQKIREDIKNGKTNDSFTNGGFYTDFYGNPRRLGKNMKIVGTIINAGLEKGTLTELKAELEVCETCGGTGEVATLDSVYRNEPHQALVGSQPCPDCTDNEPLDFSGATEGDS